MDDVELVRLIERLRRGMSRNADVMALCDQVERQWRSGYRDGMKDAAAIEETFRPKRDRAAYMREYRKARSA